MNNFAWPVRVYYEDTDAGGVVYYANYLKFFERARTERLRALGFEQDELKEQYGIIFAVRSIRADYLKPARFNGELFVSAEVAAIKRASLLFEQAITLKPNDNQLLCTATARIACLDADDMRPRPMPGPLRERIL